MPSMLKCFFRASVRKKVFGSRKCTLNYVFRTFCYANCEILTSKICRVVKCVDLKSALILKLDCSSSTSRWTTPTCSGTTSWATSWRRFPSSESAELLPGSTPFSCSTSTAPCPINASLQSTPQSYEWFTTCSYY